VANLVFAETTHIVGSKWNFACRWVVCTLQAIVLKSRLHDTTCKVVSCKCLYTRYNRLSYPLSNAFDNRLYRVYKHSTGCQTRLTTGLTKRLYRVYSRLSNWLYNPVWQPVERTVVRSTVLNEQLFVQHGCQTGCQTRLTTGLTTGCIVYTNTQPVVKPVLQPVGRTTNAVVD